MTEGRYILIACTASLAAGLLVALLVLPRCPKERYELTLLGVVLFPFTIYVLFAAIFAGRGV